MGMTSRAKLFPPNHTLARQPLLPFLLLGAVIPVRSPCSGSGDGCGCQDGQRRVTRSCFHRRPCTGKCRGFGLGQSLLVLQGGPTYGLVHVGPAAASAPAPTGQSSGFSVRLLEPGGRLLWSRVHACRSQARWLHSTRGGPCCLVGEADPPIHHRDASGYAFYIQRWANSCRKTATQHTFAKAVTAPASCW